ncbi:MAG: branched-chain amino acid ABC transporter permease [Candidatus Edwardsbacteria bacterium]
MTHKFFSRLFWPVWFGFLMIPFLNLKILLLLVGAGLILFFIFPFFSPWFKKLRFSHLMKPCFPFKLSFPLIIILFLLFLLILPLFLNRYFLDVLTIAGIYIVLALGLNIVVGLSGLLVLGYIAFYAVGAYAYALLSRHQHISFFLVLPFGAVLAFIFGILLGMPTLRLRGDYLAIVTLGFGEMVRIVLNNWDSVTGGPNGILHIARPKIGALNFNHPIYYYYSILLFVILASLIVYRLNNSRIGRAWVSIREDELAAEASGIDTTRLKLLAFALSASFAGTMGVFFAAKMTFVSPESFTFWESVMVLCMVVLGGMGSIPGVILGATALIILPEALRKFQLYRMLIFGATMVLMMAFRPQGLIPSQRKSP